jgi:type IV secretory pathway VirB9-like protein
MTVAAAFAGDISKSASTAPVNEMHGVRIIYETEIAPPQTICFREFQEVTFHAPEGEKFTQAFIGDPVRWPHEAQLPGRFYSIKPSYMGLRTTIHLTTDHDNDYAFNLESCRNAEPDVTVILKSNDPAITKRIADHPSSVPYEMWLAEKEEKEAAEKRTAITVAKAKEDTDKAVADAVKTYPKEIVEYDYDKKTAAKYPWFVDGISHDDRFAYIKRDPKHGDLPNVFGIGPNGKKDLIVAQYDPDLGMYVIPRVPFGGYLSFGGQKKEKRLEFHSRERS